MLWREEHLIFLERDVGQKPRFRTQMVEAME